METEGHCQCKGQVWTTSGLWAPVGGRGRVLVGVECAWGRGRGVGEEGTGLPLPGVGVQRAGGG